ncbi:MAG TPA: DUF932 domain-containing protein [Candidatus Angelobacter sp.]|nr:DUF932 domain-containing protein [Candidatus Angelobacter sp.]
MRNFNSFSRSSNQPLTLDQIGQLAPSAIAITAHSSRSDRYAYIPTLQIIQGMEKAGFLPFSAKQSRTRLEDRRDFTKHMIRFRHVSQEVQVGGSFPEVVLINSHDGTSAYKLMAGIFRLVCSNGLVVASSMQDSITVRHQGNIIQAVVEGSTRIIEAAPKMLDAVNNWTGLMLTAGEQQVFAEAAHSIRFGDEEGKTDTPIKPAQLLQARRTSDTRNDLYTTLNRIQENVIRGGVRALGHDAAGHLRRTTTREVKGIDQDVKLNRALWTLAEKMAQIKNEA